MYSMMLLYVGQLLKRSFTIKTMVLSNPRMYQVMLVKLLSAAETFVAMWTNMAAIFVGEQVIWRISGIAQAIMCRLTIRTDM